ncbi:MAG: fructose 1,6-bisphosphatase [Candidatus Bathyarchaeota archaeon]|nr:fructose 1,6-bisphosphatase [Candidatus Bathyarchaeota archaeon]
MGSKVGWQNLFLKCRENIRFHLQPLLPHLKDPQPDLGLGAGGDQMKVADLTAEMAIVDVLLQNGVSFTLVSEESGVKEYGAQSKDCYVIVDPIDGTTNLTRGLPFYCSSIAVSDQPNLSSVHAAMVTDLFHLIDYTAFKGKGAFRNVEKIVPSKLRSLQDAVIGLDLNTYKVAELAPVLSALIANTKHIRHFGANALELCYVADGLTDAFVDIRGKLRTTDVAAGFLILKEAGGTITTPDGGEVNTKLDPRQTIKFVASGNHDIHDLILNLINQK